MLGFGKQDPGLHVHVTPELLKSLAAVAVSVTAPPNCTELVAGVTLTLMGGGVPMVMLTVAVAAGLVVDCATTVTVPPVGIACGAV